LESQSNSKNDNNSEKSLTEKANPDPKLQNKDDKKITIAHQSEQSKNTIINNTSFGKIAEKTTNDKTNNNSINNNDNKVSDEKIVQTTNTTGHVITLSRLLPAHRFHDWDSGFIFRLFSLISVFGLLILFFVMLKTFAHNRNNFYSKTNTLYETEIMRMFGNEDYDDDDDEDLTVFDAQQYRRLSSSEHALINKV
jgi:hypothetical protein